MAEVSKLTIGVSAHVKGAIADLNAVSRRVTRLSRMNARISVTADTSDATRGLAAVANQARRVGAMRPTVRVSANTAPASARLAEVAAQARRVGALSPTIHVEVNTTRAERGFRRVNSGIDGWGSHSRSSGRVVAGALGGMGSAAADAAGSVGSSGARMSGTFAKVAGPLGIGLAIGALHALGALAPVVGGLLVTGLGAGFIALGAMALSKTKAVKGAFEDMKKGILSSLQRAAKPMQKPLIEGMEKLTNVVKKLEPLFKKAFTAAGKLIDPIVKGISKFANGAMPGIVKALERSKPIFEGLADMMGAIGTGVGQMFDEMTRDPAAVKGIATALKEFGKGVALVLKEIGKFIADMAKDKTNIDMLKGAFRLLAGTIRVVGYAIKALNWLFRVQVAIWKWVIGVAKWLGARLVAIFKAIGRGVRAAWNAVWRWVKNLALRIWRGIVGAARWFWRAITGAFRAVGRGVRAAWNAVWRWVKGLALRVWRAIVGAAKWFWRTVTGVFKAIGRGVRAAWRAVWNWVKGLALRVWRGIVGAAKWFWRTITGAFRAIGRGVRAAWRAVWNWVKSFAKRIWNGVVAAAKWFWRTLTGAFKAIGRGIRAVWNAVWSWVKNFAKRIWDGIVSVARGFWRGLKAVFSKIWNGLKLGWKKASGWVKDIVGNVVGWVKDRWDGIVDFFKKLPGRIASAASGLWDGIKNAFKSAINWLIDKWNGLELKIPIPKIPDWIPGIGGKGGGEIKLSTPNIPRLAMGGMISGPGSGTADRVPAMLSNGEYVIRADMVKRYKPLLDLINSGRLPGFAKGGPVGGAGAQAAQAMAPKGQPQGQTPAEVKDTLVTVVKAETANYNTQIMAAAKIAQMIPVSETTTVTLTNNTAPGIAAVKTGFQGMRGFTRTTYAGMGKDSVTFGARFRSHTAAASSTARKIWAGWRSGMGTLTRAGYSAMSKAGQSFRASDGSRLRRHAAQQRDTWHAWAGSMRSTSRQAFSNMLRLGANFGSRSVSSLRSTNSRQQGTWRNWSQGLRKTTSSTHSAILRSDNRWAGRMNAGLRALTSRQHAQANRWSAGMRSRQNSMHTGMLRSTTEWGRRTVRAFDQTQSAVGRAWAKVKPKLKEPINYLVHTVINKGVVSAINTIVSELGGSQKVKAISVPGFASGGYTGAGGKYQPKGVVHGGEFVLRKSATSKLPKGALNYMNRTGNMPGYAEGGLVKGDIMSAAGIKSGGSEIDKLVQGMEIAMKPKGIEKMWEGVARLIKSKLISGTNKAGGPGMKPIALNGMDFIKKAAVSFLESALMLGGNGFVPFRPWKEGDGRRVSYRGAAMNYRTMLMLQKAEKLAKGRASVTQGSFSSGVAASAGTHNGGGVLDLAQTSDRWIRALRASGFAAWARGRKWGSDFSPHTHAVAVGDHQLSPAARQQVRSFMAGRDGLKGNGPDPHAGLFGGFGGIGGSGAGRWRGVALQALRLAGESPRHLNNLLKSISEESGGNPRAINNWDSNARRGQASRGLNQVIPSTFNAFAGPLRSRGIWDPLANIYASIKYARNRYGSRWSAKMAAPGGYASGTMKAAPGLAMVGENGPELMAMGGGEKIANHRRTKTAIEGDTYNINVHVGASLVSKTEIENAVVQGMFEAHRHGRTGFLKK